MTKVCTSVPVAPILRTVVQYLIAFCSRLEVASDVISGANVEQVGMDVLVKFTKRCFA